MGDLATSACPTRVPGGMEELARHYDGFLIDQWGVLHDGQRAFPGAARCLRELEAMGKVVVLISNSGKRGERNEARLARLGFARETYAEILTSGDAVRDALRNPPDAFYRSLGPRCFLVSNDDDRSTIQGLAVTAVEDISSADFILLAGSGSARLPTDLDALWAVALARRLPLVCANPDCTRFVDGRLVPGSGALARRYEELGGLAVYVGKPHPEIYRRCLRTLESRGVRRIVAVGDSLDHDIAGAARMGLDTVLVTDGILRDRFEGRSSEAAMLARLGEIVRADGGPWPTWVMSSLNWCRDTMEQTTP